MAEDKQPDYASRVPKYAFAETLEEQEAELATNPMIQRFIESRRKARALRSPGRLRGSLSA